MDHATGQDRVRKPACGGLDLRLLLSNRLNQFAATLQIFRRRWHHAAILVLRRCQAKPDYRTAANCSSSSSSSNRRSDYPERARSPALPHFPHVRAMFFVFEDFAAEKFAAFQMPITVSSIPESIRRPASIQMKAKGFNRPDETADDTDAIDQMKIDFGYHPIPFIDPDPARGFVDEPIFEAA